MITWLTEHALAGAVYAIGALIAGFIAKKAGSLIDVIEAKTQIDIDDKIEERIQLIVKKVVLAITQTYVSGLKAKGKFDSDAQGKALKRAVKESGKTIFEELGITINKDVLNTSVEAELGEQKMIEKVVGAAK